ncbi:MAG: conjugative transposon protein TraM, partial [Muribaculum sp.]|nr:conjugative transposon protein TraM [Muribaculum sp.]
NVGNVFQTDMPTGEQEQIGTKAEEYAAADAARERQTADITISNMDSISKPEDTVPEPSAIEESAQQYQQVQQSLNDFYVPDYNDNSEVAELQARIDELEAANAVAQQQSLPNEMELMERSYQLASQYFGNGQGNQQTVIVDEPKENRKVMPVSQVAQKVVSTLSASTGATRSFSTAVGCAKQSFRNTISACIATDQTIMDGQSVRLRTLEPMWVGNSLLPKNTTIVGKARLQGERLEITIDNIEALGCIMEVELAVYDSDGQEGINIPNSLESDALKEIGANMGSTVGSSINISTDVGAQLVSDVGKGLLNGVSQYLTKKVREVKVHLKAGYKVMLYQPEDV